MSGWAAASPCADAAPVSGGGSYGDRSGRAGYGPCAEVISERNAGVISSADSVRFCSSVGHAMEKVTLDAGPLVLSR